MTNDPPANINFKDIGIPTYHFCTAQRRTIQYNFVLLMLSWFTAVVVDVVVVVIVVVVVGGGGVVVVQAPSG